MDQQQLTAERSFDMAILYLKDRVIDLAEKEKDLVSRLGEPDQPGYPVREKALENIRKWIKELSDAQRVLAASGCTPAPMYSQQQVEARILDFVTDCLHEVHPSAKAITEGVLYIFQQSILSSPSIPAQQQVEGIEPLLELMALHGGEIVNTADLDEEQIKQAKAGGRMFVGKDSYGYVWVPEFRYRAGLFPTTPDEVALFEKWYPLQLELPESLKEPTFLSSPSLPVSSEPQEEDKIQALARQIYASLFKNSERYKYIAGKIAAGELTQEEANQKNVNKAYKLAQSFFNRQQLAASQPPVGGDAAQAIQTYEVFMETHSQIVQAVSMEEVLKMDLDPDEPVLAIMNVKFRDAEYKRLSPTSQQEGEEGPWYAVEYAGYWNIQDGPDYEDKNILDVDIVGAIKAEENAKLAASAPRLQSQLQQAKQAIKELREQLSNNQSK